MTGGRPRANPEESATRSRSASDSRSIEDRGRQRPRRGRIEDVVVPCFRPSSMARTAAGVGTSRTVMTTSLAAICASPASTAAASKSSFAPMSRMMKFSPLELRMMKPTPVGRSSRVPTEKRPRPRRNRDQWRCWRVCRPRPWRAAMSGRRASRSPRPGWSLFRRPHVEVSAEHRLAKDRQLRRPDSHANREATDDGDFGVSSRPP